MDFNTTLAVDAGNVSMGHPSMFQTPSIDIKLDSDVATAKSVNPTDIWMRKHAFPVNSSNMSSGYTLSSDPNDPPLTDREREIIIHKMGPLMDKTLNRMKPTLLFYTFFSKGNFLELQRNIRYAVNKWSGYNVGDQSLMELTLIMEYIFQAMARPIDEDNAPSKMLLSYIRNEIGRLNELVVNEATPIIINNVEQHLGYMKMVDGGISATALQRPMDTKVTGTMVYRSPTDVLTPRDILSQVS